jgi:hypothetical protein
MKFTDSHRAVIVDALKKASTMSLFNQYEKGLIEDMADKFEDPEEYTVVDLSDIESGNAFETLNTRTLEDLYYAIQAELYERDAIEA